MGRLEQLIKSRYCSPREGLSLELVFRRHDLFTSHVLFSDGFGDCCFFSASFFCFFGLAHRLILRFIVIRQGWFFCFYDFPPYDGWPHGDLTARFCLFIERCIFELIPSLLGLEQFAMLYILCLNLYTRRCYAVYWLYAR